MEPSQLIYFGTCLAFLSSALTELEVVHYSLLGPPYPHPLRLQPFLSSFIPKKPYITFSLCAFSFAFLPHFFIALINTRTQMAPLERFESPFCWPLNFRGTYKGLFK